jgi:hypothetical protein
MRRPQPQFVVHKSPKPNGKQSWYIVGRPDGQRVRAWFNTEEQALKEADRRNQEMENGSSPLSTKDVGQLPTADKLPPSSTVTETEMFRAISRGMRLDDDDDDDEDDDDERFRTLKTLESPGVAQKILQLEAENSRLRKENAQMRDCFTSILKILARAKEEIAAFDADHES